MPETSQKPETPGINKWQLASLAGEMGFIIALPLVAFALLGKFLDEKYGTEPLITLLGIIFAITCTTIWLTRRFKNILHKK